MTARHRPLWPVLVLVACVMLLGLGLFKVSQWMREPVPEQLEPLGPEAPGNPDAVKYLIVHHSLSHWGDGESVVLWHTGPPPHRGWDRPGYHAVIGNGYPTNRSWKKRVYSALADGRVDRIVSEDLRVNGVLHGNRNALQVCLIGDLDRHDPTPAQMRALAGLLSEWCIKYRLNPHRAILGHGEMQRMMGIEDYSKTCPGTHVDMDAVREAVHQRVAEHVRNDFLRR